jgi:hypothetical protein
MKKWLVLTVIFLISACSTADVSQVPTPTPQPNEVTFDGYECNLSAPAVLSIGKHSFLLKNLSDGEMALWAYSISPGHTYQELLDAQSEPGEIVHRPDWLLENVQKTGYQVEPNGDKIYTFAFPIAGEYLILIAWEIPASLWFCGTFQVIEE